MKVVDISENSENSENSEHVEDAGTDSEGRQE